MKHLLKYNLFILLTLLLISTQSFASTKKTTAEHGKMTAEQAVESLKDGNKRYLRLKLINTDYDKQIDKNKKEQHPFAAVLSCMDSRVPPEILFDQGIGNIFVVREAGNVIAPNTLGSLEYAVNVKKVALVVVLGHSGCGAVAAAVDGVDLQMYQNLDQLIRQIKVAIHPCKENIYQCVEKNNIKLSIAKILKNSKTIAEAVRNGEVKIIGAYYDIETGVVTFDKEYTSE